MSSSETGTVNVCLRVLKEKNKNSSQSYFLREVPLFDSIRGLKEHLLERCGEELSPASDTSFRLGYFGDGNMKFSITSEIQLAEGLSSAKKGMVTLAICGWTHIYLRKIHVLQFQGKKGKVCVQSNVMVNITTMRINLIFPQLLLKVLFCSVSGQSWHYCD